MHVRYDGEDHEVAVALVQALPYPFLLGRDAPHFWKFLQDRGRERQNDLSTPVLPQEATDEEDAGEGTSGQSDDRGRVGEEPEWPPEVSPAQPDTRFTQAEEDDLTLQGLKGIVAIEEGQVRDPRRAQRFPRIVKEGGVWARIVLTRGQPQRQLLVPQSYRGRLLSAAHTHAWAGHQGTKATLKRLLAQFFWPAIEKDTRAFCRSCKVCQRMSNKADPRAPLQPLLIILIICGGTVV